jgi:membrane-associated phospholipid phosphatase
MTSLKQYVTYLLGRYKSIQLIVAFILFWTPFIIFAKLAGEIIENEPILLDITILQWIHTQSTPFLDGLFLFFTTIGNVEYILPITVLILAYLVYRRKRQSALLLLFGVGGAAVSNIILKLLFQRDRPSFWQSAITETGYSFPSGHAMISSALIFCIIILLWNTKYRLASIITGAIIVILIGVSRLYLGVHYPTDVIAGWSVSLVWVLIVAITVKGLSYQKTV